MVGDGTGNSAESSIILPKISLPMLTFETKRREQQPPLLLNNNKCHETTLTSSCPLTNCWVGAVELAT